MKLIELFSNKDGQQSPLSKSGKRWANVADFFTNTYYPYYWNKNLKKQRPNADVTHRKHTNGSQNNNSPKDFEWTELDLLEQAINKIISK